VIEGEVHCLIKGGQGEATETYRAEVADETPYGGPGQASGRVALGDLLARLSDTVASQLSGQVRMRHASDAQVLAALASDQEPGVLMEAASEAGERELAPALQPLILLTRHLDDTVALRAAAAVGRLGAGDEASARALAAMTSGSDIERHLVAVQALGDVGGSRAGRYLDTLADGHPDPAIRSAARAAATRARRAPASE
jgi:HEAT repeat protein